jgi:hypothetical protein
MATAKIMTGLAALALTSIPVSAQAGSSYGHQKMAGHQQSALSIAPPSNCGAAGGSLCPPGAPTEEVRPHYYDVPSKTKHIYYQKPAVQAVTTHIIHHVPTPVYGRTHVTETVQGGYWTGPSLGCCAPRPQPPVVVQRPILVQPAPRPAPVCYGPPTSRYGCR